MKYTPAFSFKGTRFVIADKDWLADNKIEADKIGIATLFVEGILFGFQRDKEKPIQAVPESDAEGKLVADLATLKGKDLGELAVYVNIRHQPQSQENLADEAEEDS